MRQKFKFEYEKRQQQVFNYINSKEQDSKKISMRMMQRIEKIKDKPESAVKKNLILKLISDEMPNADKIDGSFFKVLELDLDDDHQAQVNAALEQFVAKANLAKKSDRIAVKMIFRRKEALEQKLFKMKYHKLLKTIADASSMASNKEKFK